MKHRRFLCLLILTFFLFGLSGCAHPFPRVETFYVSPFELSVKEEKYHAALALSPDGERLAVGYRPDLVILQTGERINLREEFDIREKITLANHDLLSGEIFWSADGRYLGMNAKHYEPTSKDAVGTVFYRFDMETKTAERYEFWAAAFSPFSSDRVLTEDGVYDLRDGTLLPFAPEVDFREERAFGATSSPTDLLWSKRLGVPVAELHTGSYGEEESNLMGVSLFSYNPQDPRNIKYVVPSGFSFPTYEWVPAYVFDPSGEYVLVAHWQCSEDKPCAHIIPGELPTYYPENVVDTVLVLVRWQTGEQQELIRLSEIDPEHVVAHGYMAWSADGSTILVSRYDAPPVVLKVMYP